MGGITWWLYDDMALGGVMMLAMVLNLLVASMMGVIIPLTMTKLGRDPAVGSSVMITAITDTGGFFIFLGWQRFFCFNPTLNAGGDQCHDDNPAQHANRRLPVDTVAATVTSITTVSAIGAFLSWRAEGCAS